MRRVLSFLMCILLVLVAFFGCSENKSSGDENIHTEYEGVYLTLGWVSEGEIKVVWHNDTAKDVIYGEYYHVERYNEESGEWESVLSEDFFVNDIGLLLRPHGENEKTYSLECFDLSADGRYRLRSDFSFGDGKTYNTWVQFAVLDENVIKTSNVYCYVVYVSNNGFVTSIKDSDYIFVKYAGAKETIEVYDTVIIEFDIEDLTEKSGSVGFFDEKVSYSYVLKKVQGLRVADPSKGDLVFG